MGNPKALYSDCGSNFKGAKKELKECIKALNQTEIGEYAAQNSMEWHFNPPDAPHMGGAWERLIGCVKVALRTLLKERSVTDFQLMTLLTEVETIVNSRPLTAVSDDINDMEALTPNHFLLGRANKYVPMGDFTDNDLCSRKRWRQVQVLSDHFWRRFRREYLPCLTKRVKWTTEQRNAEIGDLVLLVDANVPRGQWRMARIANVIPGDDGIVRVAEIKTSTGNLLRPVSKLCLLEEAIME